MQGIFFKTCFFRETVVMIDIDGPCFPKNKSLQLFIISFGSSTVNKTKQNISFCYRVHIFKLSKKYMIRLWIRARLGWIGYYSMMPYKLIVRGCKTESTCPFHKRANYLKSIIIVVISINV